MPVFRYCKIQFIRPHKKTKNPRKTAEILGSGNWTRTSDIRINRESFEYLINNQNFKFIRYTPSRFSTIDNRLLSFETPHEVIGQEFDNVVVYIGQNFFYGADGTLQAKNLDGNPYDFLGMLYQAVTRARKRLEIVIINNPQVFLSLSDILS